MRIPDFFIVGPPKCGTTAMHTYLKQHPEIFMPGLKEPHFFGSDLVKAPYRITEKEAYLALFADAYSEKRVGETSPGYLYSRRAAAEIKEFNPNADIIIMLRNPVDVMYSLHGHRLQSGNENIADFEAALNEEDVRKQGLRIPRGAQEPHGLLYHEMARFSSQIERYIQIFGCNHVYVIVYDDFKSDSAAVYRDTLRFLGVDDDTFQPEFHIINSSKRVRVLAVQYFLRDPIVRRLGRALLPGTLREAVKSAIIERNVQNMPPPPMDPELRRRLQAEFTPEVERLSELLGRDLTHWCKA